MSEQLKLETSELEDLKGSREKTGLASAARRISELENQVHRLERGTENSTKLSVAITELAIQVYDLKTACLNQAQKQSIESAKQVHRILYSK